MEAQTLRSRDGGRAIESGKNLERDKVRLDERPRGDSLRRMLENSRAGVLELSWFDRDSQEEYLLEVDRQSQGNSDFIWRLFTRFDSSVIKRWQKETLDCDLVASKLLALVEGGNRVHSDREDRRAVRETFHALPQFNENSGEIFVSAKGRIEETGSPHLSRTEEQGFARAKPKFPGSEADVARPNGAPAKYSESLHRIPSFADIDVEKKDFLSGNLAQIEIAHLIQSIRTGSLSGRLKIRRSSSYVHIFFVDGMPSHCEGSRGTGEDCFLQTLCWTSGEFEFEPRVKTSELSISTTLEKLLIQGVKLKESTNMLKQMKLHMESPLRCKSRSLSMAEVERLLSSQDCFEPELEKAIYQSLSKSVKSVQDIVEEFWLMRSSWVPALASLIKLGLIEVFERGADSHNIEPKRLDGSLIKTAERKLVNVETSMLSYNSFLYQLDLQIKLAPNVPLTLMLVGFLTAKDRDRNHSSKISTEGFSMLAGEIKADQSFNGLVGHYENEIGILMLDLDQKQAMRAAQSVFDALPPSTLELAIASVDTTQVCIGCANFREDGGDLPHLLGAAEKALNEAFLNGGGIVFARDL